MLNEYQVAHIICGYLKEYVGSKEEDRDDRIILSGIICGLLTALNKVDYEKIKDDIVGYALEVITEILDRE